jgi:hypothetical protein
VETKQPSPDFAIIAIGRATVEVWRRLEGKCVAHSAALGEPVSMPESQYRFTIHKFVAAGRLRERFVATERGKGSPVLEAEVPRTGEETAKLWFELGKPRTIRSDSGLITILFGSRQANMPGAHP